MTGPTPAVRPAGLRVDLKVYCWRRTTMTVNGIAEASLSYDVPLRKELISV